MGKVTCVECGHTEHGDSAYCLNPNCGALLPTATRPAPPPSPWAPGGQPDADQPPTQRPDAETTPTPPSTGTAPSTVTERVAERPVAGWSAGRRWLLGGLVIVTALALIVAFSRGAPEPVPEPTPPDALPQPTTAAQLAPEVTGIADDRVSVTISFVDNSNGRAAFYVVGGPVGRPASTLAEAPRGSTSAEVNAIDPEVDYCFVVVAVLSVDEVAPSAQVCTSRFGTATS